MATLPQSGKSRSGKSTTRAARKRNPKRDVPLRIDKDVQDWLHSGGATAKLEKKVNAFLRNEMKSQRARRKDAHLTPNAETIEAIGEVESGGGTRYKSAKAMFKALGIKARR
jgi:hypothetical protein